MGIKDAKCPECGHPMPYAKPPAPNALTALVPDTPAQRGGVVESNPPRLPTPSASTKATKTVRN